jgi:hypothetical protein
MRIFQLTKINISEDKEFVGVAGIFSEVPDFYLRE